MSKYGHCEFFKIVRYAVASSSDKSQRFGSGDECEKRTRTCSYCDICRLSCFFDNPGCIVVKKIGYEYVLVFPDGSKVSLDEYFTAESFSRLLERLQELYGDEYEE